MALTRPDRSNDVLLREISDLRFCCAICADDPGLARRALRSREGPIDWLALIEVARSHRLQMLLYRAATKHFPDVAGSATLAALRELYADNVARCQVMTTALVRLLRKLTAEQIPALGFKGPVFGAQFYGDVALRTYSDLDLLVRKDDIAKVTDVMRDLGYRTGGMALGWELSFVHDTAESVDVHWSIADKIHQFPLTTDELWARRTSTELDGMSAPTLCAEDALLTICFNGLTEDWQRCDRIADVAQVMRSGDPIDWPNFLDRCRQHGCERLVLVGLHLARELFLVELPQVVERRLRSHRKAIARAGYVMDDFMRFVVTSTDRRGGMDYWRHVVRMRERQWERIPYYQALAYSLFQPKDDDAPWQRKSREVLYRILRLPLLLIKHGLRLLGHANLRHPDNQP